MDSFLSKSFFMFDIFRPMFIRSTCMGAKCLNKGLQETGARLNAQRVESCLGSFQNVCMSS